MQDRTHTQDQSPADSDERPYPFTCDDWVNCFPIPSECGEHILGWSRCARCNQRFMRWKRGKVWKAGFRLARLSAPEGRRRVFLVTLTVRDQSQFPRLYQPDLSRGFRGIWRPTTYGLGTPSIRTPPLIEAFRRMARTRLFRDLMPGGMWVAECTERFENATYEGVDGVFIAGHSYHAHPHIHLLAFGGGSRSGLPLGSLRTLCAAHGFGEPNVKLISGYKVERTISYLVNYLGKEQPVARSRDTWGFVRTACSDVRKEAAAERKRQRSE